MLWFGRNGPDIATALLNDLMAAEEIQRARSIARRRNAYHGHYPKPLKVRDGQPDDNVSVNYARIIVDVGVSALTGGTVRFELDETAQTEAETWLHEVWRANRQQTFLRMLAMAGAIGGQAFVKIVPAQPYPRLILLDPETVSVRTSPDDLADVRRYLIQYPAYDPASRKPVVIRQRIERDNGGWTITDERSGPGDTWQTVAQTPWPYAWPPIVDCQNLPCPNEYWGISDLEDDILWLIEASNFLLSNHQRIIRYHGHPKTWGKGFTANQLNIAVDETIVLPSPDASLQNLEMQSDLAANLETARFLREVLFMKARIPEAAIGKLEGIGALSGVALQIHYQPLIDKTETKHGTYGELLVELNRRLLELGGFGPDNRTVIHWPELVPGDPLQERQIALLDQQLGVSQDTILQRLGFDPGLERAKREASSAQLGEQLLAAFDRGQ